nr:hypothetical protein 210p_00034 [Serratia entomophila]ULG14379.1 hypothetical protein 142p_00050 [Serratia proteamaculans]ULG11390.1 hypothetical protein 398p_00038 [Serratia entomophila]ULG11769.1 hypothetical protein 626p_00112 [Serratia entomophila]ULG11915.1 hypothetical protein 1100p_00038 [Serratia entomophila]
MDDIVCFVITPWENFFGSCARRIYSYTIVVNGIIDIWGYQDGSEKSVQF